MASATQSWTVDDLITTTMFARSKEIANNIARNNAFLYLMNENGNKKSYEGGMGIPIPFVNAENNSALFYAAAQMLPTQVNQTMTEGRLPVKQLAVPVCITGLEEIENSSEYQIKNLVTERVKIAETSANNLLSGGLYSDGTQFNGLTITGLSAAVSKIPTVGTYAGLDRALFPKFRNLAINANTDPRGVVTASNISSYIADTCIRLSRGTEGIDLVVMGNAAYRLYFESLLPIQRVMSAPASKSGAGFKALKFAVAGKDVDIVLDGGIGGQIPDNTIYCINSKYAALHVSDKRNFSKIGGPRSPINQDATIQWYGWAGNLAINPFYHGVIYW